MRRCLEKNPELWFQSASDLAFALEALSDSGSAATAAVGPINWRSILAWTAVALVFAAIGLGLYLRRSYLGSAPSAGTPALEVRALTEHGTIFRAAISSDGRYIAYVQTLADKFDLDLLQVATVRDIQLLPGSPAPILNLYFPPMAISFTCFAHLKIPMPWAYFEWPLSVARHHRWPRKQACGASPCRRTVTG